MSWSILLMPILGGYYYLTRCIGVKHHYKRTERQRLIFDSAIKGFIFILPTYLSSIFLKSYFPGPVARLKFIPVTVPFFHTFLFACLFSVISTHVFNFLYRKREGLYLAKAIKMAGNSMQQDLMKSFFDEELLMITLRNGKVYVGIVVELNEPQGQSYIRILPFYSGYRTDTMDVDLNTDYLSVYQGLENESSDSKAMETVICEDDIITTTFYRQKIFNRFRENPTV